MMMNELTNGAATAGIVVNDDDDDEKINNSDRASNNMEAQKLQQQQQQQKNVNVKKQIANIARTITNSHPLMLSPTNTDSDVDELQVLKNANFPDLIPLREHQLDVGEIKQQQQQQPNHHHKISLLRTHSPDLLSSESEADISPYHAAVEVNYQTVALLSKHQHQHQHHYNNNNNHQQQQQQHNVQPNHKKNYMNNNNNNLQQQQQQQQQPNIHLKQQQQQQQRGEDISSLDSISNHSFENEPNLASLSPSSSIMDIDALNDDNDDDDDDDDDDVDDNNDDDVDDVEPPIDTVPIMAVNNLPASSSTLPQYSANEERRDVRNWQKITLPNGSTREIDMRVIEPYKRVLSHGGYLKAGGHNAIVLFSACYLPDRSRTDYSYVMDNLFLYVVKTLEQLVTEDYVLVYLHGGSDRRSVPPFPWLKKCYQLIDRRLRKSLKNLYLVHPTFWLKSIVWMTRPFVSTKFWRKLIYVKSLEELGTHVAIEKAAIPEKVKQYDAKHC